MGRRPTKNYAVGNDPDALLAGMQGVEITPSVQPEEEQEEPGFLDKMYNSAQAFIEGLGFFPGGLAETVKDAWSGNQIDINDTEALKEREQRRRELAEYEKKWKGKAFEGVTGAMQSLPYTAGTMATTFAGAPLAAIPIAGPWLARGVGAGVGLAFSDRATQAQFMYNVYDQFQQLTGRRPSNEEWANITKSY